MAIINEIAIALSIIALIPIAFTAIKHYGLDIVIAATAVAIVITSWIYN